MEHPRVQRRVRTRQSASLPRQDDGSGRATLCRGRLQGAPRRAVLLAAGFGLRMRPLSEDLPKPLMPVAGKPIIRFIVDKLVEAGLTDFVFVIGYLGEKIRDFIEETYPDLQTEFVYQEDREGSAHAIITAREAIEDEDEIIIAFGDTIFDVDLHQFLE